MGRLRLSIVREAGEMRPDGNAAWLSRKRLRFGRRFGFELWEIDFVEMPLGIHGDAVSDL